MSDLIPVMHARCMPCRHLLSLLLLLILVGGCSDETMLTSEPPDTTPPDTTEEPSLFARYVALGSGLTAGYKADGINQATQNESYAALVAKALGTEFKAPLIEMPGCPPPITDSYTRERPDETSCALVEPVSDVFHNVAVPGTYLRDLFPAPGDSLSENPLNTLMLDGRTQLQAAAEAKPTFATVWFGVDELMDEMLDEGPVEFPFEEFQIHYVQLLDSLEAMGVQGGVIIDVSNLLGMPYWTTLDEYIKLKEQGALPPTFDVVCKNDPFPDRTSVPFPYFADLLARAQAGESVVLDCADTEVMTFAEFWPTHNNFWRIYEPLGHLAHDRGWGYVGMGSILSEMLKTGETPRVPHFPGSTEPTFGPYFSRDGIHFSKEGHKLVANKVIEAINRTYGTDISGI